jgi:hypothetical protein
MKEGQNQFPWLLQQMPSRLTAEQVASALNRQPHDVPVLAAAKVLKPFGNLQPNRLGD